MANKIVLFLVIIVSAITIPSIAQITVPFPYGLIAGYLITVILIWKIILKIDKQDRSQNSMPITEQVRNNAWFLLPIFLAIVGGVIAFFVLRKDDPLKAKNCLLLGVALMIAQVISTGIILVFFAAILSL